jgi:rubredoxin
MVEQALSAFEVRVLQEVDAATHTVFVGEVVSTKRLAGGAAMSYAYYHTVKKGLTPKNAATYIATLTVCPAASDGAAAAGAGPTSALRPRHRCPICGYQYDPSAGDDAGNIPAGTPFDALLDDWVCPVCGAGKRDFVAC